MSLIEESSKLIEELKKVPTKYRLPLILTGVQGGLILLILYFIKRGFIKEAPFYVIILFPSYLALVSSLSHVLLTMIVLYPLERLAGIKPTVEYVVTWGFVISSLLFFLSFGGLVCDYIFFDHSNPFQSFKDHYASFFIGVYIGIICSSLYDNFFAARFRTKKSAEIIKKDDSSL